MKLSLVFALLSLSACAVDAAPFPAPAPSSPTSSELAGAQDVPEAPAPAAAPSPDDGPHMPLATAYPLDAPHGYRWCAYVVPGEWPYVRVDARAHGAPLPAGDATVRLTQGVQERVDRVDLPRGGARIDVGAEVDRLCVLSDHLDGSVAVDVMVGVQ